MVLGKARGKSYIEYCGCEMIKLYKYTTEATKVKKVTSILPIANRPNAVFQNFSSHTQKSRKCDQNDLFFEVWLFNSNTVIIK